MSHDSASPRLADELEPDRDPRDTSSAGDTEKAGGEEVSRGHAPYDRPRGFFSSALGEEGTVTVEEVAMNMASIFLAFLDWGLHVALAVWLYYTLPGSLYANLATATLAFALGVNLIAIVRYVLRNTADPDSSLRERLMDFPENSTVVLVLGTINVEVPDPNPNVGPNHGQNPNPTQLNFGALISRCTLLAAFHARCQNKHSPPCS
ncbi:hypothetical protein T492DRAFT_1124565 [Pavlovales sp. CCMP2436]|nr:hypothetical protein T492DRAFT_1124565 [Pavlovales sp. CCMP2436]